MTGTRATASQRRTRWGAGAPAGTGRRKSGPWAWLALALSLPIHTYRLLLSPLLPARCRFHPSCSAYALGALETHGPFRGSWLTVRRLCRCHPFHPGGVDPVPPLLPPSR